MEVRNCKRCGKMHYGREPICKECQQKEEDMFQEVRKYLKEFPGSTMAEVSNETGVSIKKIEKYLRDGRLEVTEGMAVELKCMKCGAVIRTGRYCTACAKEVNNEMKAVYASKVLKEEGTPSTSKAKMHIKRI